MTNRARKITTAALASATAFLALGPASAHASVSITRAGTQLIIVGDVEANRIDIDRSASGAIRVDVGDDGAFEHTTTAATSVIDVQGRGGDDNVTFDETNGALPSADYKGDGGNDILQSGSATDFVNGGSGADTIETRAGVDTITGGPDADTITPGPGDDSAEGSDGDDTFVWNDEDGSDQTAGQIGSDLQVVNGKRGSDRLTLTRNGATGVILARTAIDEFEIDADAIERVRVNGNEGPDRLVAANDLSGVLESVEFNPGGSRIQPNEFDGSDVTDIVSVGEGETEIATQEGADTVTWSLASKFAGSATVDLGEGNDKLSVEGTDGADEFEAADEGGKLRVAHIESDEAVQAAGADELAISTGDGDDSFTPTPGVTSLVALDVFGGGGSDRLFGGADAETLRGGKGDDTVVANGGDDTLHGDAGTDTLVGGTGRDSFFCEGFGDTLDGTAEDTIANDCLANPQPPVANPPAEQPPGNEPGNPPAGTNPSLLPPGFRGFTRPAVKARGVGNLKVTVRNTHDDEITLRTAASERGFRYRAVNRPIQPGATARITLRVPARLRAALRRKLAKSGRLVRRPRVTVTHVATGGTKTIRPRIRLKAPR